MPFAQWRHSPAIQVKMQRTAIAIAVIRVTCGDEKSCCTAGHAVVCGGILRLKACVYAYAPQSYSATTWDLILDANRIGPDHTVLLRGLFLSHAAHARSPRAIVVSFGV